MAIPEDVAIQILHAESIHVSSRHDSVMQGQERTLALVVGVMAAGATIGIKDHPEIFVVLPVALGVFLSFWLLLMADAAAKLVYLDYLHAIINIALEKHIIALSQENGALSFAPRVDFVAAPPKGALLYGEISRSREPGWSNLTSHLLAAIFFSVVAASIAKGWMVAWDSKCETWCKWLYLAGLIVIAFSMLASVRELLRAREQAISACGCRFV